MADKGFIDKARLLGAFIVGCALLINALFGIFQLLSGSRESLIIIRTILALIFSILSLKIASNLNKAKNNSGETTNIQDRIYPLSKQWFLKQLVKNLLYTLMVLLLPLLGVLSYGLSPQSDTDAVWFVLGFMALLALAMNLSLLPFYFNKRGYYYSLGQASFTTTQGFFTGGERTISHKDITDVKITRGWLDKVFGLANIYITHNEMKKMWVAPWDRQAYSDDYHTAIFGLEIDEAEKLKNILEKIPKS